jgi:D-alanyl-lipoteichoic acid acyltransferase DltB (MBOAT superfamily)
MLFNSFEFFIFFPITTLIYFLLPTRFRWLLLLVASYVFYLSWKPEYILLLLTSTIISFFLAIRIEDETNQNHRKKFLVLSIIINIGLLLVFKYFNFFNENIRVIFAAFGAEYPIPDLELVLPLGISFYTFLVLGYSVDVYNRRVKAERNIGIYALFVSFFPMLAAGPIERGRNMLPQFVRSHTFDYERIVNGLIRIAWGFFKKLVIADRLALLVNTVYDNPNQFTGNPLILATYAFAIQIYCDFSAYSDIAIGVARILGYNLMENFQQPYYSRSIPDFWRKWHISLSTWFRDYIFFPLRRSLLRRNKSQPGHLSSLIIPPMITMLLSGLWHGAAWTFVIWGGLHGLLIVLDILWDQYLKTKIRFIQLPKPLETGLRIFLTFNLLCFTWIFFRANSLADTLYIINNLFVNLSFSSFGIGSIIPGGRYELLIVVCAITLMEIIHLQQIRNFDLRAYANRLPIWMRWAAYYALVLAILMFGVFGLTEFIYIQF